MTLRTEKLMPLPGVHASCCFRAGSGAALGLWRGGGTVLIVSTCLGAVFAGSTGPWITNLRGSRELWENLKQATFLTAKTTAMVCWLFVGSALFSAVFALHGGQKIIETWVLGMNLSPVGFLVLSQLIIFLLGWPPEWTEIIVIFCPIFIPLLGHFKVNPILQTLAAEPPLPPRFAFVKTPHWQRADADTHSAWRELCERLGPQVEELELFPSALEAWHWHRTIMEAEMALHLDREFSTGAAHMTSVLRQLIERGRQLHAFDYQYALWRIEPMYASFAELFEQSYDAILTPAALGAAPRGLEATGDPAFCTLWTLCGMPALSLPLLETAEGLPLGVQIVGPRLGDAKLLRTARWLASVMAAE